MNLTIKQSPLFETFEKIEATSSRNEKKALLANCSPQEKILLELALNPYKQFHITSWNSQIKEFSVSDNFNEFMELVKYCTAMNHSSELVSKVENFFRNCNALQAKWYERVLQKDLKFGLLEKSVNDVFGKGFVPGMDVMLAHPMEMDFSNVRFDLNTAIVERKYDGFRCVVKYNTNGIVDVIGRSGKPIANRQFCANLEKNKEKLVGLILDGEAFCPNLTFEQVSSTLRSADASLEDGFRLYLFDVMYLEEWESRNCKDKYFERIRYRNEIAQFNDFLYPIEFYQVPTGSDAKAFILEKYNEFLEEGYEGAMLKDVTSFYEWKRSNAFMKIKPSEQEDAVIIGFEEGSGNIAGMLGAFVCNLEDGTEIRVGGGYKESQRIEYWKDPKAYVGSWIKVKFTMKTASGALRHPVFKGFRDKK